MKKTIGMMMLAGLLPVGAAWADSTLVQYNKHQYKRYDTGMSWHAAKAFCEKKGGYLAVITSSAENDFLTKNLLESSPYGDNWIGGTDELQEGKWKWANNEKWSYTNFGPSEPNNQFADQGGEHYLSAWPDGRWNDISSMNRGWFVYAANTVSTKIATVCEFEL